MATFQNGFHAEGSSINRPPLFNGEGYSFWKIKMKAFIEGIDVDIWEAIEHGPFIPKQTVDGNIIEKPRNLWTSDEKKVAQYGLKAKNIIISALGHDEFCRVSNCKTAKEMWDALEVTHEGTNEVKRSRINTLTREFELFMMHSNESIQDMQKRFTHIVNQLQSLGKSFQNEDLVNKILRCLSREWQPKVTAITESRDLATMSLPTLFGKLQEHELELNRLQQNEEGDRKKKSIALKATSSQVQEEEDDESDLTEMDDETLTLLTRRFGKFLKRKGNQRKPPFNLKRNFNKGEHSHQAPTCYECGKSGHMKMECPIYKNKMEKPFKEKKGRKAYIAWDENDMDSSDESEGEEANLCLMADLDDENLPDDNMVNDLELPSYNELYDAFSELHDKSLEIAKQLAKSKKINSLLEEKLSCAHNEIDNLKKENESVKKINQSCEYLMTKHTLSSCTSCEVFQKEIDDLKNTLAKFTMGRDNLNLLLSKQGCTFKKAGIGYNPGNQQKMYRNLFVSSSTSCTSTTPFIKCHYCGRLGHSASTCNIRKNGLQNCKKMWVPKGTLPKTNTQGPRKVWVPKTKT